MAAWAAVGSVEKAAAVEAAAALLVAASAAEEGTERELSEVSRGPVAAAASWARAA